MCNPHRTCTPFRGAYDHWNHPWRRSSTVKLLFLTVLLSAIQGIQSQSRDWPKTIRLPDGFQPTSIVNGHDTLMYACNLRGELYLFDVKRGTGVTVRKGGDGRQCAGMTIDYRSNAMWVAGGSTGKVYVWDLGGKVVHEWKVMGKSDKIRLRSVITTPYRVIFLDAYEPVYYWLPVGSTIFGGEAFDGKVFRNETVRKVKIGGDWEQVDGVVNANGVEWTERFEPEEFIHVINSATGRLYSMNLNTADRKDGVTNKAELVAFPNASVPGNGLKDATQLKFDSIYEEQLYVLKGKDNEVVVLEFPNTKNPFATNYLDKLTDKRFKYPAGIGEYGAWLFLPDSRMNEDEDEGSSETAQYNVNRIRRWFRSEANGTGLTGGEGQIGNNQPPTSGDTSSPSPTPLPTEVAGDDGEPIVSPNTGMATPSSVPPVAVADEDGLGNPDEAPRPSETEEVEPEGESNDEGQGIFNGDTSKIPQEEAKCFPADATVELISGETVSMRLLNVGDRVLVHPAKRIFSEVFLFSHRQSHSLNKFIVIEAADGSKLKLTSGHYLYVNGDLVVAESVKIGDWVETTRSGTNSSRVVSLKTTLSRGLYNPQTLDGDIVVNGVHASTFTRAMHPRLAKWLLSSLKVFYSRLTRPVFNVLLHNGCAKCTRLLPAGSPSYIIQ